jgi:hypothetical protein
MPFLSIGWLALFDNETYNSIKSSLYHTYKLVYKRTCIERPATDHNRDTIKNPDYCGHHRCKKFDLLKIFKSQILDYSGIG